MQEVLTQGEHSQTLQGLIGREPDQERDRAALRRITSGTPDLIALVKRLQTDREWSHTPLGDLLPGLGAQDSAAPFPPAMSVRASNSLLRARVSSWSVLAGWTPADLDFLPGVGRITVEEVLQATLQEWGSFHLSEQGAHDPADVYEGLLALSAWGASTQGTRGAVEAIKAAAEDRDQLPPRVARAMRALRGISGAEKESLFDLERAFLELEATPGFEVFKRRHLDGLAKRPTYTELGSELGVSGARSSQMERTIEKKLRRWMQDQDWPIRLAAEQLREGLGAVARRTEVDGTFECLDSGGSLQRDSNAHRRALLLWLCDYRIGDEWVLGPEIENLTDIILAAVAEGRQKNLDTACRQLTLLGVRDEVQLGWILSRTGFRIIDDRVIPIE